MLFFDRTGNTRPFKLGFRGQQDPVLYFYKFACDVSDIRNVLTVVPP